jgi:uncharacterized protein
MSLQTDIKGQMIEAMKAKDAVRLSVIRGLMSSFTNELVAKGKMPQDELPDEDVLNVISRAVKQRKDSIEQFEKGGRADLAESEKVELEILQAYLPAQMSRDEIFAYVREKASAGFVPEQKNQFMGSIMKELKGKADGNIVREAVEGLS